MKKNTLIFFVFLFAFYANITMAALMPFGGRILTAPTPGVNCPAGKSGSPFTIVPAGVSPSGIYVGDYYPKSMGFNISPGSWVLGLYIPVPIPECQTQTVPALPVTGFRTFLHGTSSF